MKKVLLVIFLFWVSSVSATGLDASSQEIQKAKAENISLRVKLSLTMQLVQSIAKDYVYHGTGNSSTAIKKEIGHARLKLAALAKDLSEYTSTNRRVRMSIDMIVVANQDLRETSSQRFSSENIQLILDLGNVISSASMDVLHALDQNIFIYRKDSKLLSLRLSSL